MSDSSLLSLTVTYDALIKIVRRIQMGKKPKFPISNLDLDMSKL